MMEDLIAKILSLYPPGEMRQKIARELLDQLARESYLAGFEDGKQSAKDGA